MTKDNQSEEADLLEENGSDEQSGNEGESQQDQNKDGQQDDQNGSGDGDKKDDQQEGSSDEGYRAKLNAQNRFLEKEGYTFKDGKWHKPKTDSTQQRTASKDKEAAPALSREEGILIAKGFSEDELEQAKKVATLEGIKLTEVPGNELFIAWKTKRDAEIKRQQAQLGASRGARTNVKKTLATPGLSDEDHKELFKERIGK